MKQQTSRRRLLQNMTALGAAGGVSALGSEGTRAQQSLTLAQAQAAAPTIRAADSTRGLPRIQLMIGPGT
jgi:hypothetical protein